MFTDSLKKKGLLLLPGVLEEKAPMTQTRAMRKSIVDSMVSRRDSDRAEDESEEGESAEEETVQEEEASFDTEEGIDITNREAQVWLKCIGLLEYARLPWPLWESNPNAEVQLAHIKANKGYVAEDLEVSPTLFAQVFKLPSYQPQRWKKMTHALMRLEFSAPEGTRQYYMV